MKAHLTNEGATELGVAWAHEIATSLRATGRGVIGAWPGTLGEARMRIRRAMRATPDFTALDELARVAYLAARRGWQQLASPDDES